MIHKSIDKNEFFEGKEIGYFDLYERRLIKKTIRVIYKKFTFSLNDEYDYIRLSDGNVFISDKAIAYIDSLNENEFRDLENLLIICIDADIYEGKTNVYIRDRQMITGAITGNYSDKVEVDENDFNEIEIKIANGIKKNNMNVLQTQKRLKEIYVFEKLVRNVNTYSIREMLNRDFSYVVKK